MCRHGQTATNRESIYQAGDQFEVDPIDEHGDWQSRQLARRFQRYGYQPEAIITSSYLRAAQTARIINRITRTTIVVPVVIDDEVVDKSIDDPALHEGKSLFRELDLPSELQGRRYDDEVAKEIKNKIKSHRFDVKWHYSDEENLFDEWQRAGMCLDYLAERPEKRLAVVAHGGIIKSCLSRLLFGDRDWPISQKLEAHQAFADKTWFDNTGVVTLRHIDGNRWQWPISYNEHLGGAFGLVPGREQQPPEKDISAEELRADQ